MQLFFLYGPPAVGKYTVGVELAARTGFRLLHNHLTVNLVSAVFDRDSDSWVRLLGVIRGEMLSEAARKDVNVIITGVFNGTSQQLASWRAMLAPVYAASGQVLFVQLSCERDEHFRRLNSESRRALDKLLDPVRLTQLLDGFDMLSAAPFGEHLHLDVTHLSPSESASSIIQYYGIQHR